MTTVLNLVQNVKPEVFYCYDLNTGHISRCELSNLASYRMFKDKQVKRYGQGYNVIIGAYGFYIYYR